VVPQFIHGARPDAAVLGALFVFSSKGTRRSSELSTSIVHKESGLPVRASVGLVD